MSQRLPTPGGDNGDWGDILNAYLDVSHAADGTLNSNVVGTNQIQSGAVTNTQLDSPTQSAITKANSAVPTSDLGAANGVATLDSNSTLTADQLPSSVVSGSGTPTNGQVPVYTGTGQQTAPGSPNGGTPTGVPIVRAFPFSYDTPGLLTGVAVYTPTVGDVVLDGWISIQTPWDGTTPMGDVGTFDRNDGWFGENYWPLDMTLADVDPSDGGSPSNASVINNVSMQQQTVGLSINAMSFNSYPVVNGDQLGWQAGPPNVDWATAPLTILQPLPICVAVSQNGTSNGADPGSTQGAAVLYLVTVTPLQPS